MRGQTQFCVWSPRHLLLVMRICRGWYHVITITSRDPAVSVIAEMTTKIFSQTLDQDPRSCVTDTDRHDVNLKSETYSQIIKGGRGQSVLYSCPCNGHVKDPNFTTPLPQRCPLINISLSSSSLEVFTSSQVTFLEKIQEPAAGDNGAENSAGFIWHCSCQRVVGIFVMPGIATSKTLLLFMWGNATWRWPHISISIGILSCEDITGMARVFTTHKDRNIPYSL